MIGEVIERYNRESLLERHGYRAPPGSAADSLVRRRNQATHLSRRPGALHDQHDCQGSKWKKVAQHWESSARPNVQLVLQPTSIERAQRAYHSSAACSKQC